MNMPATIRAEAHASAIKSVTRLYNGSIEDITNELLQNARRAGATAVELRFDSEKRRIVFQDNGHGVANPASLLRLGSSDWNGDVASEDCAGMGFFSAAGLEVEVVSSGIDPETGAPFAWGAVIGADDWTGQTEIPVETYPNIAEDLSPGTRIVISLADQGRFQFLKTEASTCIAELRRRLERCTTCYPLPVTFNGEPLKCQHDMLEGCVAVYDFGAYRIGVNKHCRPISTPVVNFHGITISAHLPEVKEAQCNNSWSCRVDVLDARELQLVLPARKEVVKNAAWEKVKTDCLTSIYQTIATLALDADNPRPHRLSFEHWLLAGAHGIEMPPAAAMLHPWEPSDANGNRSYTKLEPVDAATDVVLNCGSANEAQALAIALERMPDAFPYRRFRPESDFQGYEWYDALHQFRISAIEVAVEDGDMPVDVSDVAPDRSALNEDEEVIAEKILSDDKFVASIHVVLSEAAGHAAQFAIPAPAFIAEGDYDFETSSILLARDHGFTPCSFASFAIHSSFVASDDRESDSYDTQQDRFDEWATERFLALTGGDQAVVRYQIEEALRHVRYAIPEGSSLTITLTREGSSAASVTFDKPVRHVELSTAHLTQEVSDILDTLQDTAENRECPSAGHEDWRDGVVVSPYRYGAWVRRFSDGIERDDMPECLKACFAHAAARGATWILFDRDVEPIDGLPSFEW